MSEPRIFAMGDTHGEAGKVRRVLRKLKNEAGMNEDDIFIQLGDIIDRGPDSRAIIDRFLELEQEMQCYWIRGNHEDLMWGALQNPQRLYGWDMNGGYQTRKSYHKSGIICDALDSWILEVPQAHKDFFYRQKQTYHMYLNGFSFSHAPIPKKEYTRYDQMCSTEQSYLDAILMEGQQDQELLSWAWHGHHGVSEDEFALEMPNSSVQVVGHVHRLQEGIKDARVYPHIIYTDSGSGCASFGRLCAVQLPEKILWYSDE